MRHVELLDPSGTVRGTFDGPASLEALLSQAWSLGPGDRFIVLGLDETDWSLAIYRPDAPIRPHFLGPRGTKDRSTLIELAWLALLDDGWAVRAID